MCYLWPLVWRSWCRLQWRQPCSSTMMQTQRVPKVPSSSSRPPRRSRFLPAAHRVDPVMKQKWSLAELRSVNEPQHCRLLPHFKLFCTFCTAHTHFLFTGSYQLLVNMSKQNGSHFCFPLSFVPLFLGMWSILMHWVRRHPAPFRPKQRSNL